MAKDDPFVLDLLLKRLKRRRPVIGGDPQVRAQALCPSQRMIAELDHDFAGIGVRAKDMAQRCFLAVLAPQMVDPPQQEPL